MIKVEDFYACNDEELQDHLNEIQGRIISIKENRDDNWQVIYDSTPSPTSERKEE